MSDLEKLKTEIALLKKDAKTGELIHQRLEVAVDKLTEITISLKGMIAQQQTKLERAKIRYAVKSSVKVGSFILACCTGLLLRPVVILPWRSVRL